MQGVSTYAGPINQPGEGHEVNPYVEFTNRYQNDWVGLVRNVFGAEPDPFQEQILTDVQNGERRISVRSGHGVGKSATAAWICVCALVTTNPVKIVITAPSGPQLWDALFAEVKMWFSRLPEALQMLFDPQAERIEHKGAASEIFISARTSRAEKPEAMQGVHAEGGRVILIGDEASGIPESVYEAGAGSMSGRNCTTLLFSNPTRTSGFFFDTHHRLKHMWKTYHVSCLDSKRVDPDYISDMVARYGEDSNAYRVRVLGEFPMRDDDTMIALELIEAAFVRDIILDPKSEKVWGLDVARFGSDLNALVKRWGKVVPEKPKTWRNLDLMQTVGRLKHEYDSTPVEQRPLEIMVDVIGLGAGVVDRGRELQLPVRGINVSEAPAFGEQYVNLRAELWGKGKSWFESRDCKLANDQSFLELSIPRYTFQSNGKLKVESKDDMKKRGIPSPNIADAFLLTLAGHYATGMGSSSPHSNWSKPLRRNLKGVSYR